MHGLDSQSMSRSSSSKGAMRLPSQPSTKAYLSYPDYTNSFQPFLGFDISEKLGLVAAATEDSRVKMYNLWTGKVLHAGDKSCHISPHKTYSIGPRGMRDRHNDEVEKHAGYMTGDEHYRGPLVKCLRFVGGEIEEDFENRHGMQQNEEGLLVACGDWVDMWSWSQPLWESDNMPR